MAAVCAKPGCEQHAEAWWFVARGEQSVSLHGQPLDGAVALCSVHVGRFSVPDGWTLLDERMVRSDDEPQPAAKARRPWFADDSAPGDTVSASVPRVGGLLDRAFNGPSVDRVVSSADELEARRLARLERVHHQIDRIPQRLRDRQEQQRHEDRDHYADPDDRSDGDIGPRDDGAHSRDDEEQAEAHDRVDAYGTNELPFPPFEGELATRAALG